MTGNTSIDLSLKNIWHCYHLFRRGKKITKELDLFQYYLEENLYQLYLDLHYGSYRHGCYKEFIVTDNKKRQIRVANIRDRVVHRLLYEYLYPIYDPTFIYDTWSCRKDKGLIGAINRAQKFMFNNSSDYVWRADIKKFFDHIDHEILLKIIKQKITDTKAINLLQKIIASYSASIREREKKFRRRGIPIGNLTSQIFANIYLNELDHFIKHDLKVKHYLRYGDDFIIIEKDNKKLIHYRLQTIQYLAKHQRLNINPKNDLIIKSRHGIKFLGVWIYPTGKKLLRRNWNRIITHLNNQNSGSYFGLLHQHGTAKQIKYFSWLINQKLC